MSSRKLRPKQASDVNIGGSGGQMLEVTDTTVPGRSCLVCRGEDTDEMVSCDICEKWHHYACVGVTHEIEKHPWSCTKCETATGVQMPSSNANKPSSQNSSQRQKQQAAEIESPADGKQRKPKQGEIPKPAAIVPSTSESMKNKSPKSHQQQNAALLQSDSIVDNKPYKKPASLASGSSSRSSQALLKLKLQKLEEEQELERRQAAERAANEKAFLDKKYELLGEMVNETGSGEGSARSYVSEWVDNLASCNGSQRISVAKSDVQRNAQIPEQNIVPGPRHHNSLTHVPQVHNIAQRSLTNQQLASRQAICRELPAFSGNPEEWPLFLSSFNSTTEMCGFSDAENMIRLQKSLRGRAYDAVKCRLMHPANVNGVMATLKMLFGQPEAIVHTLIAKINCLPAVREDKLETLVDFAVSVENFCATVDACGVEEYLYNVSLLHQLVSKLPPSIKLNWAQYRQKLPTVNLASFSHWLYSLAEAASAVTIPNTFGNAKPVHREANGNRKCNDFVNAHSDNPTQEAVPTSQSCLICKGTCKVLSKCKRFLSLSRDSRWAAVREFGLCRRCLRRHNGGCQTKVCGKNGCHFKHHELLHNDELQISNPPVGVNMNGSPSSQSTSRASNQGCHTHQVKSSQTLFRYLPVMLHGKHGSVHTFAFLDDGSALTLLDNDLADELGLEGQVKPLCLHWTGGTQRQEDTSRIVNLEVSGAAEGTKRFGMSGVRTVDSLLLPSQSLNIEELSRRHPYLRNLPIASYDAVRPRILIGMKDQHLTLVLKSREGGPKHPLAVKTRLGWTVCGGGTTDDAPNLVHSTFHVCACGDKSDEDLHQAMKEYFSLDSLGVTKAVEPLLSKEDQRAQSLLQNLTRFTGTRYETGLLWRYDEIRLPDSQLMAQRRFNCLEKRMAKDSKLAEALRQKIADYIDKGYIRKLSDAELGGSYSRIWYLPVFPVTNPNKPGKLRIVWDAAATAFGKSLNCFLLKGIDQLISLFSILVQFREGAIGLTGDLREMFHQIMIREEDQQCQRFYWREADGQLSVYIMRVMTFGACCSPSSAQYAKNINAERMRGQYPKAADIIQKRHYVDDMLVSVDTEEEAIQLAMQVRFIHKQGGFEIRNWISNSQRVLTALNESSTIEKNLDLSPELATEKVLGMWWCTASDVFTYKIGWNRYEHSLLLGQRRPTKREMLRVLMSMFDPLGLIAHFLMYLKILLQEVWRSGVAWDEEINDALFTKWRAWLQVLPQVETLKIRRCYRKRLPASCTVGELHTFVDASENGMAAACYIRFSQGETTECSLVAAKTRVAPLKFLSIPRLELQAAVLGVRLSQAVADSLSININRRMFWSDSRDVICWVNSDHRRFTQFVAHRVSEILDSTEAADWRWVPTKQNVADDGTKWVHIPDMSSEDRWYTGPDFLWRSERHWPSQPAINSQTDTELRPHLLLHFQATEPLLCVNEFSSWRKITNIMAYVFRFSLNYIAHFKKQKLTSEIVSAENYLIRQAQADAYPDEIALLQKKQHRNPGITLPKNSPLYKLTPWIDEHGVLRMRGRIAACHYATADAKNPIILPHTHHTTLLIIAHYHQKYHHRNHETVINQIRQRYCIFRLRATVARVRNNCQRCKNERVSPQPPIMADLPPARLDAFTRPFTNVGIDYFGPLDVAVGRRSEKRWGMLVTCLTVRAVHIEVVHSLNTNSCIMALRNFISRRGTPRTIYSDRGTNFIGACRELQQAEADVDMHEMAKEFVSSDTKWVFLPPLSPHMGGCWERLIGTVKRNLITILPSQKMSDEMLRNALTEIEHVVNSRPLTHVPVDDDSAPALTPNHFLLGSSDGTKPPCTLDDSGTMLRRCWRTSQILANRFWRRWVSDYLPVITRRAKWFDNVRAIQVDDVVVIVDPKWPRNCWPKGKVIEVCRGRDGLPRSATVRTASGIYERPVVKLAVLDVRRDEK